MDDEYRDEDSKADIMNYTKGKLCQFIKRQL